jgi:TM2 domain-containing membrane protein YozV
MLQRNSAGRLLDTNVRACALLAWVSGTISMSELHSGRPGVSDDARAMMMFEANKKSMVVSYLLWFFFGTFGGHRFYNGKIGTGVAQLLLTIVGALFLFAAGLGMLLLVPVWIWVIVDAFLIPGWIRTQNSLLAAQLGGR